MADEIEEIRARIDIVDLVGQSVSLKRAGNSYKGLCPFHQDKNPSFSVTPQTGRYRCWSCGEHGDIFTWIEKTQNVSFVEALQILAERAGVELKAKDKQDRSNKLNQRAAMEAAQTYFRDSFAKSKQAQEYCSARGLDTEVLDKWEVGFAPAEGLAIRLKKEGFRLAECKDLFLVEGDDGRGYGDKFKERLMFPIRDERGDLVAFGGRIIGVGNPKYINSSDTPLYKKGKVLYGMNLAKEAMRTEHKAVLVEGFLDVIACHSAGVKTAVASLGTALSQDHGKLLKRWCDAVTVLYDSDAAGKKAAERAAEILLEEGLQVRVALVPEGKDPDTMLRSVGPEAVKKAAEGGVSPLEYRIGALKTEFPIKSEQFWTAAVQVLSQEPNELERGRLIESLAPQYPGMKDKVAARQALTRMVGQPHVQRAVVRAPVDRSRSEDRNIATLLHPNEAMIFWALLDEVQRPTIWPLLQEDDLFLTKAASGLAAELLKTFFLKPPEGSASVWMAQIESNVAKELLSGVADVVQRDVRQPIELTTEQVDEAVKNLRKKRHERKISELERSDEELATIHQTLRDKG